MSSITRDMEQYIAVEKFEQYELTTCMAYEFAIRNKKAQEAINILIKEYFNNDIIDNMVIPLKELFAKKSLEVGIKTIELHDKLDEIIEQNAKALKNNQKIIASNLYLKYHFFNEAEEHINIFLKTLNKYGFKDTSMITNMFLSIFSETNDIVEDFIGMPETKNGKVDGIRTWDFIKNSPFYEATVLYDEDEDKDGNLKIFKTENFIRPRYSRPLLYIAPEISRNIDIDLNSSLPEKELIDFIKKIKKKNYIAAPTLYDFSKKEDAIYKNRELGSRSVLTNQYKLAELLFIYDATQLDMSIAEIQDEVWKYKGDTKANFMDKDTIKSRLKTAKDYIDNMRYKELLAEYSLD